MAKASVITTVYNDEQYIAETIDSVLKQKYEDFEMIIVDDGSTDNSSSVINQTNDHRIKFFKKHHMGRPKALNFAISKASSEYIAILDSDDIALPERLAIQIDYLNKNPNVGLVGAGIKTIVNSRGDIVKHEETEAYSDSDIRKAICNINPLFHSSVMFRRELFDKVNGYDEKLSCLVDMDFYVRIAPFCELVNIPKCLSYKREHDEQFFGGIGGVHKSRSQKRARAIIIYRSVIHLNAPKINLLRALKMYVMSLL